MLPGDLIWASEAGEHGIGFDEGKESPDAGQELGGAARHGFGGLSECIGELGDSGFVALICRAAGEIAHELAELLVDIIHEAQVDDQRALGTACGFDHLMNHLRTQQTGTARREIMHGGIDLHSHRAFNDKDQLIFAMRMSAMMFLGKDFRLYEVWNSKLRSGQCQSRPVGAGGIGGDGFGHGTDATNR